MDYSTDSDSNSSASSAFVASRARRMAKKQAAKGLWPSFVHKITERFAQLYYRHGLMCSRHPFLVIWYSLMVFAVCCLPLLRVHLISGNSSQQFVTNLDDNFIRKSFQRPGSRPPQQNTAYDQQEDSFDKGTPRWVCFFDLFALDSLLMVFRASSYLSFKVTNWAAVRLHSTNCRACSSYSMDVKLNIDGCH